MTRTCQQAARQAAAHDAALSSHCTRFTSTTPRAALCNLLSMLAQLKMRPRHQMFHTHSNRHSKNSWRPARGSATLELDSEVKSTGTSSSLQWRKGPRALICLAHATANAHWQLEVLNGRRSLSGRLIMAPSCGRAFAASASASAPARASAPHRLTRCGTCGGLSLRSLSKSASSRICSSYCRPLPDDRHGAYY